MVKKQEINGDIFYLMETADGEVLVGHRLDEPVIAIGVTGWSESRDDESVVTLLTSKQAKGFQRSIKNALKDLRAMQDASA